MQSELQGTVVSVQGRTTKNGKTVYDIAFSDNNTYATFDSQIAGVANALKGQPVVASVSVKQNGQYTNYFFEGVTPNSGVTPAAAPVAVGDAPASSNGAMTPEREQKIVKQSSLSTAFHFIASLYQGAGPEAIGEASENAHKLARELYGHVMGGSARPEQKPPEPTVAVASEPAAAPAAEHDGIPW